MRTFLYGDNVDTDVIIPARYLNAPDLPSLAAHCMEDIDPAFAGAVRPGDVVAAGENFGCGSSREHAPMALLACGVRAVVARSFARIFYRNALNIGLLPLECPEAVDALERGGALENISEDGVLRIDGTDYAAASLPPFIRHMTEDGGLLKSIGKRGSL